MSVTLIIKVIPQAGKQKLWRDKSGIIKCAIKSAPEKGKANSELIIYLSKLLSLPRTAVGIVRGETDRTKTIVIETEASSATILQTLGLETQVTLK